jgi:hypothetical protein
MKRQIFYLKPEKDLIQVETTEPLIIWTICLGPDVLAMPELNILMKQFYFSN